MEDRELEWDEYLTLSREGQGLYSEKGSKFIGYAFPIRNEEDLKGRLEELRKEHHKARHHCYAFRIHPEDPYQRANDDGEPGHSAGTPILHQILSHQLMNVGIVVVRYFGGTKLGVSGLIRAYGDAAREAISNSLIVKEFLLDPIELTFGYPQMNEVMRIVSDFGLIIENQEHTEICRYSFGVRRSIKAKLLERVASLRSVDVTN